MNEDARRRSCREMPSGATTPTTTRLQRHYAPPTSHRAKHLIFLLGHPSGTGPSFPCFGNVLRMRGRRRFPNILVTGTPGTGKTTLCDALCEAFSDGCDGRPFFEHIKVGQLIREKRLYTEWDDALDVPIFDEEMVAAQLEEMLSDTSGGKLVDFHSADFLPPSLLDLVIVLRADTAVLYDRLQARGYPESKIQENVQSEIFQIVLEEVKEAFEGHVECWEVPHNTTADLDQLVERMKTVLQKLVDS